MVAAIQTVPPLVRKGLVRRKESVSKPQLSVSACRRRRFAASFSMFDVQKSRLILRKPEEERKIAELLSCKKDDEEDEDDDDDDDEERRRGLGLGLGPGLWGLAFSFFPFGCVLYLVSLGSKGRFVSRFSLSSRYTTNYRQHVVEDRAASLPELQGCLSECHCSLQGAGSPGPTIPEHRRRCGPAELPAAVMEQSHWHQDRPFLWIPLQWILVLAGLSDMARPAEKLSLTQNAALMATGAIWTRWCLIIKPRNVLLATVNFFVGCVGFTQVTRIFLYRRSQDGSAKEAVKDLAHEATDSAKAAVHKAEEAVKKH
ncbi:uncharacterized protein ARB_07644 [Trichophyton benhamiae CBS 112371]|uniref:Mitochondrial pyruvate carrier n=1 Tax=Arthroderma benhamiae (strain ATCC MYA-4681 / CBS 112371) TaxID=663331 RepID=D4ATS8_ARTBC|nr:uncharacterized protein ARB_07644 [Trichophyton benhamiae CBS 112371]EFE33697.1 hypothetical protein ARB_07644 [Trichophyton benhamiae CBS 112371]